MTEATQCFSIVVAGWYKFTMETQIQESKTHHHVPQFYLKRWCDNFGKVIVIRNFGGRIHRRQRSPENTGCEDFLYSYHENFDASDRAEIETKFFKPLDNEGARIVSKMIEGGGLEKRDRILWAQFLLSMKVCTPENVAKVKIEGERALTKVIESAQTDYAKLKQDADPATAVDWLRVNRPGLVESIGVGQLPKIVSNTKAMQDVLSFDWHIVDFGNSSKPLLTSDRPCVYTEGLHKPNCVIVLPLSLRQAFFAFRANSNARHSLMQIPISRLAAGINESVVGQAVSRAYSQSNADAPDKFFRRCLSPSMSK